MVEADLDHTSSPKDNGKDRGKGLPLNATTWIPTCTVLRTQYTSVHSIPNSHMEYSVHTTRTVLRTRSVNRLVGTREVVGVPFIHWLPKI
jgi:hypothetical protein